MAKAARKPRSKLRLAALGALALVAALGCALLVLAFTCPSAEALREFRPPQASRVLDREGKLLARLAPEERIVVPLAAMSPRLIAAVLSVEDQRFWLHGGIDWRRVAGALLRDLQTHSLKEGSSTITMQLARNVFPDRLTRARTWRRKIAEMIVARRIERAFSKQQILELYLNQIYLGNGYYGVEAASRGYFGRPAKDLTVAQAALLAALPKAPSNYDPRRFPEAALKRRNLVLAVMARAKAISSDEEKKARAQKLRLRPPEEEGEAPWYLAAVRRELHDRFGPDAETQGLRVRTALDAGLQKAAARDLVRQLEAVETGKLGKFSGKPCAGEPEACLEGAFVALDARTGEVRALVGGRDYELSEFDRATQARRQAGSTFKAFVWAAALEAGVPVSTMLDPAAAPADYAPADGQAPSDKPLNLRDALRISSNRAAVALGRRVGLDAVISAAHSCGVESDLPRVPSVVLGSGAVTPIELVAGFAPFANGGFRVKPRFVTEVRSATGELLWREAPDIAQVLPPGVSYLMSSLLGDVVNRGGTGAAARTALPPALAVLGKTGTTNGAQDVWFVGGTPELVAGVWMGFDKPRSLGPNATGGKLAAPVWGRIVAAWQKSRPLPLEWVPPMELVQRDIDSSTGGLATDSCPEPLVAHEWFLPGTEPTVECADHRAQSSHDLWDRTVGRIFR